MTTPDPRFVLAASNRSTVVGASGLLAGFNDAGVVDPLDVAAAMSIGRLLAEPDESVQLAAALAVRGTRFGHVCIRLDTIREAVVVDGQDLESIEALPWPDPDPWHQRLAASVLVGDGSGDHPLVLVDGRLYLERYFRYEQQVAAMILRRCAQPAGVITPTMAHMLETLIPDPAGENRQRRAAETALTRRFAVIAGGPGTGKTHTVGAILSALTAENESASVALCAPTGKAAARLGEAIAAVATSIPDLDIRGRVTAVTPSTIHRLLGWRPGRGQFVHDAGHRLPHDVVVVDEMSMVSLPMAAKLLAAVGDDASVVLVGDPFQLESIEAGTVLTDIVAPAENRDAGSPVSGHIVILDRVHRFDADSAMADFAQAVRTGDADTAIGLLSEDHDALRWVPDRSAAGFSELWQRLMERRAEAVRLAGVGAAPEALAALNQVAVLCARRHGPDSVAKWGRDIEADLDQRFTGLRYGGEWYPGRPVMITSNDYRLDLFNGDIGVTVQMFDGLRVVFERGGDLREHPLARLGEHATVHAMTIHKSQGSQFEEVVVVLPDEASRLLTRELLYTAVTRASKRVWLVADEAVVRHAITRSVERASGLGTLLSTSEAGTV